jgi:hypothetical protein
MRIPASQVGAHPGIWPRGLVERGRRYCLLNLVG